MKRFFQKIWGHILYGLAKTLDVILGGINKGISFLVEKTKNIRNLLLPSLGCLAGILFLNPLSWLLLTRAWIFIPLLFIFVFPLLGTKFVSFLEYWKYSLCEYLYAKSDDFIKGTSFGGDFSNYKDRYKQQKAAEEAAEQRRRFQEEQAAREQRRREQQEQWARIFEEFFGNMGGAGFGGSYGGTGYSGTGYGGQRGGPYGTYNPTQDFRKKYEASCQTLGLPFDTDEYQVKLAYRKMAKKYHPDLNKAADAKEKFQKIGEAYEFLSKENIDRYKRLKF